VQVCFARRLALRRLDPASLEEEASTTLGFKTWLGLKKRRYAGRTLKRWPVELAEDHEGPIVTFGIPLRSAKTSTDWKNTQALLGATLRSVLRQSDSRWRVVVCGHDMPDIAEIADPRVEFIASTYPPPPRPQPGQGGRIRDDKLRKRVIIGLRLSKLGGGYYMDLDADDLIHRDLVGTALATEHGCIITAGYICDAMKSRIAPLPGVLSVDFDRVCGSTAVIRYEQREFPQNPGGDILSCPFVAASHHGYLRGKCDEIGRPLSVVPFSAAIYVVNTNENVSFVDTRRGEDGSRLLSLIRAHAITDRNKLGEIADQFGWVAS